MPVRTLLGFGPHGDDVPELRALQLAPLNGRGSFRLVLNLVVAMIGASSMVHTAAPSIALMWLAASCTFAIWSWHGFRTMHQANRDIAERDFFRRIHLHSVVTTGLWLPTFWFQGAEPTVAHILPLWTVTLLQMVALTIFVNSIPMACMIFILPISLSASFAFAVAGEPVLAVVVAVIGFALGLATIRSAQSYVLFRHAEATLHEKSETVSLLLKEFEDASADWLWQTDPGRRLEHVSPRFAYALGMSVEQLDGMPLLQAISGDAWDSGRFPAALHDMAEKMKRRESFSDLIVPVSIGGKNRWWELSASPRVDETGRFMGFRGVGSDVTAEHQSASEIARMARYDNLTGLPNRLHLNEMLEMGLSEATAARARCALLIIDLDRFKAVNDTLGHPVGDQLLAQVSARLRALIPKDSLCGRLGGDEFAVVMRTLTGPTEAEKLGQQIIEAISRPYVVDNHQLFVGASIGFAIGPQDGASVETLTRNADLALYKSKDRGGNVVAQYDASLHAQAEERRVMEQELRGALERGEFHLNFQPVVEAADGTLDGFEALIRWTNPRLGNVSPAKFIPLAEEARLIGPIGEWVMRTACREACRWPSNLKIAVNVSAEQLTDAGFASVVVSALAQSGLSPHRLEIEVTESVFLRDGGGATQLLDQLLLLGVRLSLDDFGTGYSSLGYLRKTHFSTIKVDRSFVQGAAKNKPESIAIISAVVALADALGMSTTAEGAETEHEVETIRALGCRKIQGYYYGRPMAASDVMGMFGDGRARVTAA
ncbi:MAG: EAL domain-containing protein [Sphingopyxis sp.]|nr:EAL domain-containing protein [Sphingopyxis sp.]